MTEPSKNGTNDRLTRLNTLIFSVLSGSGVADQIELLRWVNKMIPYFGGNKDNVTLLVHDHKDSLIHQIEEKAGGSLFTRVCFTKKIFKAAKNEQNRTPAMFFRPSYLAQL